MASWSLVGRADELALVREALQSDQAALGLTGDPGVGKSELARQALGEATRDGHSTHWIGATSALSVVPYGAVAHLIPLGVRAADPDELAERIITSLGDTTTGRIVLAVDDANLLDRGSAELIARLMGDRRIFTIVTTQSGESAPPAIEAVLETAGAPPIVLQPLERRESDILVATVLRGPIDPSINSRIWETANGNPLFVRELLLAARDAGELEQRDDTWIWAEDRAMSPHLADVVDARVARADVDERQALDVLAVGEPVEYAAVAEIAGASTVDRLSAQGLIAIQQIGNRQRARLAHPLYSDLLRPQLEPERRRVLLGSLADVIEATGARRTEDPLRLATFRLEAGGDVEPALLTRAAQQATDLFDQPLAESLTQVGGESS